MEPLKNIYTPELIASFADQVNDVYPSFAKRLFLEEVFNDAWPVMELKQRMRHITVVLHQHLPPSYEEAINVLLQLAPGCKGMAFLFFPDYVEQYGLTYWDTSMKALACFTQYSTAEYAVRPFIEQDQFKMMRQMRQWAKDRNVHIRRLASEGCRPRLPWASPLKALQRDPEVILPILEQLKQDDEKYVMKSVANNLNDISKDHPQLVFELAQQWYGKHPSTDWIVRHGCRTLLKKRHQEALLLFGLKGPEGIAGSSIKLSPASVNLGESVTLSIAFDVPEERYLRVEYSIGFIKANGKGSSKLFRVAERTFTRGGHLITKTHHFKDLSTRKHYPGNHHIGLWINGRQMAEASLALNW